MRRALAILTLALLPLPAFAQTDISTEIGKSGLKKTEARLAALPSPTDAERFALGGVRFLAMVETALQMRWNAGLLPNLSGMPFFSLPVAENPNAPPFDPKMIATLFRTAATRMPAVREPLAAIPDGSEMKLQVDLADIWFDIDQSGTRDPGESLLDVAGPMFLGWSWQDRDPATPAPVITFDVADVAWLSAYSHFLEGFSDSVLAYDPTAAITEIRDARRKIDALRGHPDGSLMLASEVDWIDLAAIVLHALNQPPDKERAAAAQREFLAMVSDNRILWQRVARETDNDHEWIPNDGQTSALGVELPKGTGAAWLAVLSDVEALLKGDQLAPYLWLGDDAGVNVGRMFTDPRPIDIADWVQGIGALPYLEKGTLASPEAWMRFEELVSGNGQLLAVFLN